MPFLPPPLTDHPARQHDHVATVLLAVDDDVPEAVLGDPLHGPPLPRPELSKRNRQAQTRVPRAGTRAPGRGRPRRRRRPRIPRPPPGVRAAPRPTLAGAGA